MNYYQIIKSKIDNEFKNTLNKVSGIVANSMFTKNLIKNLINSLILMLNIFILEQCRFTRITLDKSVPNIKGGSNNINFSTN